MKISNLARGQFLIGVVSDLAFAEKKVFVVLETLVSTPTGNYMKLCNLVNNEIDEWYVDTTWFKRIK